jgi:hypothetical protein
METREVHASAACFLETAQASLARLEYIPIQPMRNFAHAGQRNCRELDNFAGAAAFGVAMAPVTIVAWFLSYKDGRHSTPVASDATTPLEIGVDRGKRPCELHVRAVPTSSDTCVARAVVLDEGVPYPLAGPLREFWSDVARVHSIGPVSSDHLALVPPVKEAGSSPH